VLYLTLLAFLGCLYLSAMIKTQKIVIEEVPKGQRRPKFVRRGSFVTTFDPDRESKLWIKHLCREQVSKIITCPIEMELIAYMPIPKSTSKKKVALMLNNDIKHIKIPDGDNIFKKYSDALTGLAYNDDRQIWKISIEKRYSTKPRVEITLSYEEG